MAPEPANHDFDFWLGEWNVHWGDKQGTNFIESILEGAVIQENFDGDGLIGTSVSVFSREDQRWHQTWVDNTGSYLDFVGVVEGKAVRQRMVWYDITPNAFLWSWERSDDEGKSWREMWKLEYKRKI
jgi:hypothetical protein